MESVMELEVKDGIDYTREMLVRSIFAQEPWAFHLSNKQTTSVIQYMAREGE